MLVILRFVMNILKNGSKDRAEGAVKMTDVFKKAGFLGALVAQMASLVKSSEFVSKGLPTLTVPPSEHLSLLSDPECFSVALKVLELLTVKPDHYWNQTVLPVTLSLLVRFDFFVPLIAICRSPKPFEHQRCVCFVICIEQGLPVGSFSPLPGLQADVIWLLL